MRRLGLVLALVLLLAAGCATAADISSDAPLVVAGGETLLTGEDFARARLSQALAEEYMDKEHLSDEELFRMLAEYRVAAYIAREYGLEEQDVDLAEEYDFHMQEIQDESLYPGQLDYVTALQEQMGMTDEEFREWSIAESAYEYDAQALVQAISDEYPYTDPEVMGETVRSELLNLFEMYGAECAYPGVEGAITSISYLA